MRDLSYQQTYPLDKDVTEPRYLVEITLDSLLSLSSGAGITNDSTYWAPGEIHVDALSESRARLRIHNPSFQYTGGAMAGQYLRNSVKIWSAYPKGDLPIYVTADYWSADYVEQGTEIDVIPLFDGYIESTPTVNDWLSVTCEGFLPKKYPSVKLRAPIANHLPPTGMVVAWNSETYRIES